MLHTKFLERFKRGPNRMLSFEAEHLLDVVGMVEEHDVSAHRIHVANYGAVLIEKSRYLSDRFPLVYQRSCKYKVVRSSISKQ